MFKFMNKVAHSYWYDLLGIAIIVLGCASLGYFSETMAVTPAFKSGSWLAKACGVSLPIGLISIVSALFSLESDRFESRLSNIGNWVGIPSIVMTAFVDYSFGNRAWFSYGITMIIQFFAIYIWHVKGKYNVNKLSRGWFILVLTMASLISFVFAYGVDVFGFGIANAHGAIFWTTTFAFAISMVANLAEMFKLQFNNKAWIIYNLVQLAKAFAQGNLANVFKDVYYLGNNAISIVSWSDKGRADSAEHEKIAKKAVEA